MIKKDDPVKRRERNANRLNIDLHNKERKAQLETLMRITQILAPTPLVMHLVSIGTKLYAHKQAGGTVVLRGPRGGEEELELL